MDNQAQQSNIASSPPQVQNSPTLNQTSENMPVTNKPNHNFLKLLVVVLVVSLIGMSIFVVYLLSKQNTSSISESKDTPTSQPLPTKTETVSEYSDWNTYTNTKYGFTFSYPTEYKIWNISDEPENIILGVGEKSAGNDWPIAISVNKKTPESIVSEATNIPENSTLKVLSNKNITFLTYPAKELIIENTPGGKDGNLYKTQSKTIIFSKDSLTYTLSTITNSPIFEHILSTFKFTDQNQESTTNLKTYNGDTYSVKYPNDFQITEEVGNVLTLVKSGSTQKKGTELYDGISLRFQPKELAGVTPQKFAENQITQSTENGTGTVVKQPSPYKIGTYSGVEYTMEGLGKAQHIVLAGKNGLLMHITNSTVDPQNLNYQKTVDQIISSFKFID